MRENRAGAERLGENTRQQGSLTPVEEREYEGWVKYLRMLYCLRSGQQGSWRVLEPKVFCPRDILPYNPCHAQPLWKQP